MGNYSRDQVMNVIASVMGKVSVTSPNGQSPSQQQPLRHIHEELASLAQTIDNMHAEILATRSQDISDKHVPTATDELDAVIGATEDASATIMDSCEAIQGMVESLDPKTRDGIFAETTKIFEACSFQDITGQRIAKVVGTLKQIEGSIDNLLELFGHGNGADLPPEVDDRSEDEKLKNGPQLAGQGISQDDIDKLLAEFD